MLRKTTLKGVMGAMAMLISPFFAGASALQQFDMGDLTIQRVRTGQKDGKTVIVAASYEGIIAAVDYSGKILWQSKSGDGTIVHDLWCDDITGDGEDEIFAANGDGHLYCFDMDGELQWKFAPAISDHLTPFYSVCVVKDKTKTPYVVCGNFDNNCYYLNSKGELVKVLESKTYSKIRAWGNVPTNPLPDRNHANFLRPLPLPDGSDLLVMAATNNHMQNRGQIYILEPLKDKLYFSTAKFGLNNNVGDLKVVDPDGDGKYEILLATSSLFDGSFSKFEFDDTTYKSGRAIAGYFGRKFGGIATYRVNQFFPTYDKNGKAHYNFITSDQLFTVEENSGSFGEDIFVDHFEANYAYYDVWSEKSGHLIVASCQDGGSTIYLIDTKKSSWKNEYASVEQEGKIAAIFENSKKVRKNLKSFEKPQWQRPPVRVVGLEGDDYVKKYGIDNENSVIFMASPWNRGKTEDASWRSPLYDNNTYKKSRDGRNKYVLSHDESVAQYTPSFKGAKGISTWAGHGNDPLMYSLETLKEVANYGYEHGKKPTIYVYPEMNKHDSDFDFVLENHIYPLADYLRKSGSKIVLRAKDIFFQGPMYTKTWERVASGEFADVFVAAMEETTDKTQDMSIASRMGFWLAGCVDGWAVRCSRDDPSFDRCRQFSTQKVSNHFLRKSIYSLALGASYLHSGYPNEEHMTLYLELLNKEALYVPKRNEIVSLSPVHISMYNPAESFLLDGENNKWTTLFDRDKEESNPAFFSHMNGSWMGAALTPWDFSTIASGVKDRRQNAIPSYPNGLVTITPVQEGTLADKDAPRGRLVDKLHPMYKDILKEYITDGVDFISADGKERYKADEFYKVVAKDIEEGAKKLPLTVSGKDGKEIGWVVAQMAPKRLRLTLVDGGWLNPSDKTAVVKFHTATPLKVVDVLDKTEYKMGKNQEVEIDVPCGMFRFIDILVE